MRTGITNLPLHYGSAPPWLFERMTKLGREITIAIVREYGAEEMLKRLADPFWFQSFGCVLGFDWHSSGLTTTMTAALKEGLRPIEKDLGFFVCGGKGKTSRKTPIEIQQKTKGLRLTIRGPSSKNAIARLQRFERSDCGQAELDDDEKLIYASRLAAKVDNTALQDGFQLYHHAFFFTKSGQWGVVQQGLHDQLSLARRYHWLSDEVKDFVEEPESAICSDQKTQTLNLVAKQSNLNRKASAYISTKQPEKVISKLKKFKFYNLPHHHEIFIKDLKPESLNKILLKTYATQPRNFEQLLGIRGVGPKTIRALSLIAELIYDAKPSREDPVRYSFAHGGKDGHPYPVEKKTYDQSIEILEKALSRAKIDREEKRQAFQRLAL